MEKRVVYFEQKGPENTEEVLNIVKSRIKEGDIKKKRFGINQRRRAKAAMDLFADAAVKLVIVPHQHGFREVNRFPRELAQRSKAKGIRYILAPCFSTPQNYMEQTPPGNCQFFESLWSRNEGLL
jgi:hypothetical protein